MRLGLNSTYFWTEKLVTEPTTKNQFDSQEPHDPFAAMQSPVPRNCGKQEA
jgi:hypothetical protein